MNITLSRRVAVILYQLELVGPDLTAFLKRISLAKDFDSLVPADQAIIVEAEKRAVNDAR